MKLKDETKKTIERLYKEILYRDPDQEGLEYYGSLLESKRMNVDDIKQALLQSDERSFLLTPNEIKSLESNISTQNKENKSLINKIAKGSSTSNEDNISLINLPLGYNNFIDKKQTSIEEVTHKVMPSGTHLDFKIVNNIREQKLSGYIFVIRISNNNFEVYPNIDLGLDDFLLNYNRGESFTASRFRPVYARFNKINANLYTYKVIVFSKLGDLIFKKNFGPYKNE